MHLGVDNNSRPRFTFAQYQFVLLDEDFSMVFKVAFFQYLNALQILTIEQVSEFGLFYTLIYIPVLRLYEKCYTTVEIFLQFIWNEVILH